MIISREYSHIVFKCFACSNRRLWPTAWGTKPSLRCREHDSDIMEKETLVPNGCLWVEDEYPCHPRVVLGVDPAVPGGDMSVYAWIGDDGNFESERVNGSVDDNVLVVLNERRA